MAGYVEGPITQTRMIFFTQKRDSDFGGEKFLGGVMFEGDVIAGILESVVEKQEVVLLDTPEKAKEWAGNGKLGDHVIVWKQPEYIYLGK